MQLADELAALRDRYALAQERSVAAPARPSLLARGLRRLLLGRGSVPPRPVGAPGAVLVDATHDTAWAHTRPGLDGLVHIFHQEWHGIRSAAGYLPGRKVAISVDERLSLRDLERVVEVCAVAPSGVVVMHGWSDNATLVTHAVRKALGSGIRIKVVWHGNTAQFANPFELRQVGVLLDLVASGVVDRLASVKPDLHLLSDAFHSELLLNVGPRVASRPDHRSLWGAAFIPVPNDWRKNLFTNLFAASAAGLKTVFVTTELPDPLPVPVEASVKVLERPSRATLLSLISQVDLILNVSLSECQPMTALEGLSMRVPCLTGPLQLGALDDHPYQRLVQVVGVDTLGPVVEAIRRVRELERHDRPALDGMMADYEQQLVAEAFTRYQRFLE